MNCASLKFALTLFAVAEYAYAQADAPSKSNLPKQVVAVADIETSPGGYLGASIDLGGLPAGKKSPVKIVLNNESDQEIPIRSMSTTCSCLKLMSKTIAIPAEGSVEMLAELDIPAFAKAADQQILFTIFYAEGRGITVRIRYEISGLVSFSGTAYSTKVLLGEKRHQFDIPIVVTSPAKLEDLVVSADDSLGDIKIVPIQRNGEQFLQCSTVFEDSRVSRNGLIRMSVPGMKNEPSFVNCIVGVEQQFEIAPTILWFTKSESEYSARAVIKVHRDILFDAKRAKEFKPEFSFRSEGENLRVSPRKIATGVYRIEVLYDRKEGNDAEPFPKQLECKVRVANDVFRETMKVVFLRP